MMQTEWPAFYLDGRTAARRPATVRLMPSGLSINVEGEPTRWWPFSEVRQTQGFYPGDPVRLERGAPIAEVLVVTSTAFLEDLQRVGPALARHLDSAQRRRRRVRFTIFAGVAVVPLALALYWWAIPALAGLTTGFVPVTWEDSLGKAMVAELAPPALRCDDATGQQALDGILNALTAPLPRHDYAFRLYIVNSPVINALAAPGGHVVILRGLLERTESAEELAGVLAHEAQHVLRRHTTRALLQHASTGILVAGLLGDVTGVATFGLQAAQTLGALRYSRLAEEEADREGMKMLIAAKVDGRGMVTFFESLARHERASGAGGVTRYLASHPSTLERIAKLRALAAAQPPVAPLAADAQWTRIRALCARPGP